MHEDFRTILQLSMDGATPPQSVCVLLRLRVKVIDWQRYSSCVNSLMYLVRLLYGFCSTTSLSASLVATLDLSIKYSLLSYLYLILTSIIMKDIAL